MLWSSSNSCATAYSEYMSINNSFWDNHAAIFRPKGMTFARFVYRNARLMTFYLHFGSLRYSVVLVQQSQNWGVWFAIFFSFTNYFTNNKKPSTDIPTPNQNPTLTSSSAYLSFFHISVLFCWCVRIRYHPTKKSACNIEKRQNIKWNKWLNKN